MRREALETESETVKLGEFLWLISKTLSQYSRFDGACPTNDRLSFTTSMWVGTKGI